MDVSFSALDRHTTILVTTEIRYKVKDYGAGEDLSMKGR